jgi:arabinose-5-phosphate isomerase
VSPDVMLTEALLEMTRKGLGMTAIVDDKGAVLGVFTDGDLRRVLDANVDVRRAKISEVMTKGGKRIGPQQLAAEAVKVMETHKITALMVIDDQQQLLGVLHMHDLLRAGVV